MKISVVIATYNRRESLMATLGSLEVQRFDAQDFEIIVVDDGSRDDTAAFLTDYVRQANVNIRFLSQQNRGPATARNVAIQHAKGTIIAFTDDDCLPNPNWLSAIASSFQPGVVGLQGITYTDHKDITPLTHQIENLFGSKDVPTCNAAYLKPVLEKLSGFDELFPYPHNEDADLAWRAKKLGTIRFCHDMIVSHPPRKDSFLKVAKRMKILESEFRLYYKDPDSYRLNRTSSIWRNIYWQVGVKTQFYYLLSRFKFVSRPVLMVQGFMLTFIWWFDLIRSLPRFLKIDRENRIRFGK